MDKINYHPKLIEILATRAPAGAIISNIIIPLLFTYIVYDFLPLNQIYIWLFLHIILFVFRIYISKKLIFSLKSSMKDINKQLLTYLILISLTAILYGSFIWMSVLHQVPDLHIFMIASIIITVSAGATAPLGSIYIAFVLYVLLNIIPLLLAFIYHGGEVFIIFASIIPVLMFMFLTSGYKQFVTLKDSILIKEEKEHLNKILEDRVKEEVEKNRLQNEQMLQQSRLAQMGEMISMIAHQWRQPLGAISATAVNMQLAIELEEFDLETKEGVDKSNEYFLERLENINEFVRGLTTTIDDFRNFYKPNKKSVLVKLDVIILKAMGIIKASLDNDKIKVVEDYKSKDEFEMYDSEMMQVVLNILKNAQDNFREKEIENPQIIIETYGSTISIYDNGGGVAEDIIDKIFEPYFSTKDDKNGTGLGLYMSKTIVEEHHKGSLSVTNKDEGVCFKIELKK